MHYNDQGNLRHLAVRKIGSRLAVYFTRIGDRPERIMRAWIDLTGDWSEWMLGPGEDVIRPTADFEGANLPLRESKSGMSVGRENALRDPAVFVDDDGKTYMLYSVMGEQGIAIAELEA
jgi:hypothetical protein